MVLGQLDIYIKMKEEEKEEGGRSKGGGRRRKEKDLDTDFTFLTKNVS